MLSTPFLQMFQGLSGLALPFKRLEKAVLRGAVRVIIAGRFAASPHPEARTIQRLGKGGIVRYNKFTIDPSAIQGFCVNPLYLFRERVEKIRIFFAARQTFL